MVKINSLRIFSKNFINVQDIVAVRFVQSENLKRTLYNRYYLEIDHEIQRYVHSFGYVRTCTNDVLFYKDFTKAVAVFKWLKNENRNFN